MFLYLIEFDKYPKLVKIGITISTEKRFAQLESVHGPLKRYKVFKGKNYKQVEKLLHNQLKDFQQLVEGDGGTEFFKKTFDSEDLDVILKAAKMKLVKYSYKVLDEKSKTIEWKIVQTLDEDSSQELSKPKELEDKVPLPIYSRNLLSKYVYIKPDPNNTHKRNRLKHGITITCPLYAEEEFALIAAQQAKGFKSLNDFIRTALETYCSSVLGKDKYDQIIKKQFDVLIHKTTKEERDLLKQSVKEDVSQSKTTVK